MTFQLKKLCYHSLQMRSYYLLLKVFAKQNLILCSDVILSMSTNITCIMFLFINLNILAPPATTSSTSTDSTPPTISCEYFYLWTVE